MSGSDRLRPLVTAANAGDYITMGTECRLASTRVNDVFASVLIAPHQEWNDLVDAIFEKYDLLLFWCSGGDQYSADASTSHFEILRELNLRLLDSIEAGP